MDEVSLLINEGLSIQHKNKHQFRGKTESLELILRDNPLILNSGIGAM